MTDREMVIKAAKNGNKKAAAWIRKAGGTQAITDERASRIAKLCGLGKEDGKNGKSNDRRRQK